MKNIDCPACGSIIALSENCELTYIVNDKTKNVSYAPSARIQLMTRIIYLLIGALLALSGVSLKSFI
jgi:hypothetical protein